MTVATTGKVFNVEALALQAIHSWPDPLVKQKACRIDTGRAANSSVAMRSMLVEQQVQTRSQYCAMLGFGDDSADRVWRVHMQCRQPLLTAYTYI